MILHYLKGCKGLFALALLFSCLGMTLNAAMPQIIKVTVDSILGTEAPELPNWLLKFLSFDTLRQEPGKALWIAAIVVLAVAILRGVCAYGQRVGLAKGSERFIKGLRDDLYRHIMHLSYAWHTAHSTGDMIQRCTSDVDVVRSFVCNQLVEVIRTVFLIILYLFFMVRMNVKL